MCLSRKYHELIEQPPTKTYYKAQILFQSGFNQMGFRRKTKLTKEQPSIRKWCQQILFDSVAQHRGQIWDQYETLYISEEEIINIENRIGNQQSLFHQQKEQILAQSAKRCRIMDLECLELKFEPFNFMKTQQQLSSIQY